MLKNHIWGSMFEAMYGRITEPGLRGSHQWRSLKEAYSILKKDEEWIIGNGEIEIETTWAKILSESNQPRSWPSMMVKEVCTDGKAQVEKLSAKGVVEGVIREVMKEDIILNQEKPQPMWTRSQSGHVIVKDVWNTIRE